MIDWRCDYENSHEYPEYYITNRDQKTRKPATRHHIALGSDFAPDCSKLRSREKLRYFEVTSFRKGERFHRWIALSPVCVHLGHLQLSLTPSICTFQIIKGKEKKQIIFLYISIVVLHCYTTIAELNKYYDTYIFIKLILGWFGTRQEIWSTK